jgi:hypothetical protein
MWYMGKLQAEKWCTRAYYKQTNVEEKEHCGQSPTALTFCARFFFFKKSVKGGGFRQRKKRHFHKTKNSWIGFFYNDLERVQPTTNARQRQKNTKTCKRKLPQRSKKKWEGAQGVMCSGCQCCPNRPCFGRRRLTPLEVDSVYQVRKIYKVKKKKRRTKKDKARVLVYVFVENARGIAIVLLLFVIFVHT